MKKLLVNLFCAFLPSRRLRHAVRAVYFPNIAPLADPNEVFVPVEGFFDVGIGWMEYMLTHDMPKMMADLRKGLDTKSNETLDLILSRTTILPAHYWNNYKIRQSYLHSLHSPEELEYIRTFATELPQYIKDFALDEENRNVDTFTYHSGLRDKSNRLKAYITGKDFIDGGAYIGDTALLYMKYYNPGRVYSFEISEKTRARYENVMHTNNIPPEKYKLVPMGLSDRKQEVMMNDTAYQGTSVLYAGDNKVLLTDIDSFASENKLKVGFIKADVEGVGLEATRGMAETIKRDRPVLNISIYHNPKEFFEIKPALDEITAGLDYKVIIDKHYPWAAINQEVVVFAYPNELDND